MWSSCFVLTLPNSEKGSPIVDIKKFSNDLLKVMFSLFLGGAILYWMYRDFDFKAVSHVMRYEMNWTWMLLSLPFGVLAQMFRGWRWRQTLEPVGEHPRTSVCLNSIFLSYAVSLVIPRIGELARCGVLKRYDGTSFPKALGTVVIERAIDTLVVAAITALTLLMQFNVFRTFFNDTGTNLNSFLGHFTTTGYLVTALCAVVAAVFVYYLIRKLTVYDKLKDALQGIWQGIVALKNVRNVPRFCLFTLAIWASYFLHYYLTFFCFDATKGLGIACALVTFIVGSIAVIVPTPNGAGPWHFAVKTMLILYGVADNDALYFVLIVHAVQTLLVIALGIYAWMALMLTKVKTEDATTTQNI